MKIVCDNCSTKYSIADEKVRGKVFKIKCKKCSHIIVVKGQEIAADVQAPGFDQKETKVFDYSGFEGQKDGPPADPIWHLVIDREQVGPLTLAELQQKWTSGEADVDTYAWREGFDDWKRLGAIEELGSILRRPEAAAAAEPARGPGAGLFGAGAVPTTDAALPTVSRADPTDLFAGAGSSTEDEPPNDLFGGRAAAPQPSVFASSAAPAAEKPMRRAPKEDQPLFSMAAAEGGGNGYGTDPIPKADVRPMTAQRNENSVLFSLNNLAALATNAADPSPPKSSVGSSFSSSGPEGSGLIDIRAMAAMTLGGGKRDEGPRAHASDDDLPVFSASSFSTPAAAVLLPTVQKSSSRGLYILGGVLGFLVLAMIGLVAFLFLGGRRSPVDNPPPPTAATNPAPTAPTAAPSTAPTTAPPATTPTGAPPTPTATSKPATTAPATPTQPPAQPTPPPATAPAVVAATPTPPPRESQHTTPPPPKRPTERPAPPPPTETAKPPAEPPAKPVTNDTPAAAPTKAAKCDEVACLVTPDLPCCPKKGGAAPTKAPSVDSSLPDKLDQSDIIAGMKNVNSRVLACNDKARGAGAFKVKVTVGPDGNVSAAQASPPVAGTAAAGCVEGAVRGAKFKKTKNSITFNYPYTFH